MVLQVAAKVGCKCYGVEKAETPAKFAEVIKFPMNNSVSVCQYVVVLYPLSVCGGYCLAHICDCVRLGDVWKLIQILHRLHEACSCYHVHTCSERVCVL